MPVTIGASLPPDVAPPVVAPPVVASRVDASRDVHARSPAGPRRPRTPFAARFGPLPAPVRRILGSALVEGLATPHGVDRYLGAIHPLWTLGGGWAVVTDVRAETPDMVSLTLRPDHGWTGFRAGQHVRIGVEIAGVRHTRTYSVSCSQHRGDGRLTITVKRKDGGLVSGHLSTEVVAGDVVACSPALGEVVLPDPRPEALLLVSGGSGITPMASMLRTLADERHTGRVVFLHYARTHADVAFADDLDRIAARLPATEVVIVPTAPGGSGRHTGRFVGGHLDDLVPDHLAVPTFVCGPSGLVDAVEAHYAAGGAIDNLRVERFTPQPLRAVTGPGDGTVRFAGSDVEVADDGRSLLEQAESAGLTPISGCRMGICHTCTTPRLAGASIDLRTGRRSGTPEEKVQICVSVAAGDVVLDL